MRVVVLTSARTGFASLCLERLAGAPDIDVALVVLAGSGISDPAKNRRRTLQKVRRIGFFGALNGLRMRRWYEADTHQLLNLRPLDEVASERAVPFAETPVINCAQTVDLFREAEADLGLSLGNGYIGSRVFRAPRYGMVNVHHEVLPRFRGAQSVIWPIYEGLPETGYTIHEIDRHIDTGRILYQERFPIAFQRTLRETTAWNYARLWERSADGLVTLIQDYEARLRDAAPQGPGASYTTPTIWQFARMLRQHDKLRAAIADRDGAGCATPQTH